MHSEGISQLEQSVLHAASLDVFHSLMIKHRRLITGAVFYFWPRDSNLRTEERYGLCSGRSSERQDAIFLPLSQLRTDVVDLLHVQGLTKQQKKKGKNAMHVDDKAESKCISADIL